MDEVYMTDNTFDFRVQGGGKGIPLKESCTPFDLLTILYQDIGPIGNTIGSLGNFIGIFD